MRRKKTQTNEEIKKRRKLKRINWTNVQTNERRQKIKVKNVKKYGKEKNTYRKLKWINRTNEQTNEDKQKIRGKNVKKYRKRNQIKQKIKANQARTNTEKHKIEE